MAAKRTAGRAHWPLGMMMPREGYYSYRSPISGRNVAIGRVSEAEAMDYCKWANKQAEDARFEDRLERVKRPHVGEDARGLLDADYIASKAMLFDRIVGVYFLLQDDKIVYVGKSTSVMTRLAGHKQADAKTFNRVFVVECPEGHLDRLERMYIDKFKPDHNMSMPFVDPKAPLWSNTIRDILAGSIHQA